MNIKEISKEIHETNVKNGFWEGERNTGELLMLVTSELAEALEADRKGYKCELTKAGKMNFSGQDNVEVFQALFRGNIKDTFEDEIADAVIRLFDLAEGRGIDLEWHIAAKLRYNKTRPYKHGKAY